MNYFIVTAANRSNVYLRSGELQEVSKTILYVTAYSVCYIALTAYILMMWAVDVLLTPHFDNSWSPEEWEISPVHTVCSQPTVEPRTEEAKARQVKYAMPIVESFKLVTTPRHQRFAHDQIVSIGLELCDLDRYPAKA